MESIRQVYANQNSAEGGYAAIFEGDKERDQGRFQTAVERYKEADGNYLPMRCSSTKLSFHSERAYLARKKACLLALLKKGTKRKDLPVIDWSQADNMNSSWMAQFEAYMCPEIAQAIKEGDRYYRKTQFKKAYIKYQVERQAAICEKRKCPPSTTKREHQVEYHEPPEVFSLVLEGDIERANGDFQLAIQKYEASTNGLHLNWRDSSDEEFCRHLAPLYRKMACLFALEANSTNKKPRPNINWSKADDMNSTWMVEFVEHLCPKVCRAIKAGDALYQSKCFWSSSMTYFEAFAPPTTALRQVDGQVRRGLDWNSVTGVDELPEGWLSVIEGHQQRITGQFPTAIGKFEEAANAFWKRQEYHNLAVVYRKRAFLFALKVRHPDENNLPEIDWSQADDMNSMWMIEYSASLCFETCLEIKTGDTCFKTNQFEYAYMSYSRAVLVAERVMSENLKRSFLSSVSIQSPVALGAENNGSLSDIGRNERRMCECTNNQAPVVAAAFPSNTSRDTMTMIDLVGMFRSMQTSFRDQFQYQRKQQRDAQRRWEDRFNELAGKLDAFQKQTCDVLQHDTSKSDPSTTIWAEPPDKKRRVIQDPGASSSRIEGYPSSRIEGYHEVKTKDPHEDSSDELFFDI